MQQTLTTRLHNDKVFRPEVWAEEGCNSCPRRQVCLAGELEIPDLQEFNTHVNRQRSVRIGQLIVAAGDPFKGIYVVRSGFFKSYLINRDGELQVTGFHLPSEVFGIEGISGGPYNHSVEALDTGSVCRVPAALFHRNSVEGQAIVHVLLGVMSRIIIRDNELIFSLAKLSASRRLATFLIDLSMRMQRSGFSRDDLMLCMRRTDIASYLGLAEETVSRLFTRFQRKGILTVNRRYIESFDLHKLQIAAGDEAVEVTVNPTTHLVDSGQVTRCGGL